MKTIPVIKDTSKAPPRIGWRYEIEGIVITGLSHSQLMRNINQFCTTNRIKSPTTVEVHEWICRHTTPGFCWSTNEKVSAATPGPIVKALKAQDPSVPRKRCCGGGRAR